MSKEQLLEKLYSIEDTIALLPSTECISRDVFMGFVTGTAKRIAELDKL